MRVQWFGQSAFRLEGKEQSVFIDPDVARLGEPSFEVGDELPRVVVPGLPG